jgi:hypothetical protein
MGSPQVSRQFGAGMGSVPSGVAPSSGAAPSGFRTMYVPLEQVQSVLAQNPGARMVGTVSQDEIPAGAGSS